MGATQAWLAWKRELQRLAAETGLSLSACHYPPGTSKWNRIEHRLFCPISQNWRARPLPSRLAVVELIGATITRTGLKVSNAEMEAIALTGDNFHPEWNYTISPRKPDGAVILA